jgi:AraC family multidrug resistance transcriptional activator
MAYQKMMIESLIDWIEENIRKPLTIDDVASKAGYSKWHLQRIFYQITHDNLGHYIRSRRMSLAAKDLIESDERIIDISYKYGFDSQQAFTRCFSKEYHFPPAVYRREHKKANN